MHFSVAALLLPLAACRDATIPAGGANCPTTCYGATCLGAGALYGAPGDDGAGLCATMESWGCDCAGCDCEDSLDLELIENVPEDYACGQYGESGLTCDDMAYLGFSCHHMETRRNTDCSGCLCEEAILGYVKGDENCPQTCMGSSCDNNKAEYPSFSCAYMESHDMFAGCDCSGCDCEDADSEHPGIAYNGMDCNGNAFWTFNLGDEVCDEEVNTFAFSMGNPDDGYEERTWFVCLSCPELECDMGDCGEDACGRDGSTCALPLDELCADEDSIHTPSQFGREQYCTEEVLAAWEARTEAPEATEATVAAEEDGALALATTAVFAFALLWA